MAMVSIPTASRDTSLEPDGAVDDAAVDDADDDADDVDDADDADAAVPAADSAADSAAVVLASSIPRDAGDPGAAGVSSDSVSSRRAHGSEPRTLAESAKSSRERPIPATTHAAGATTSISRIMMPAK
jgi:hypothetical protein